MKIQNKKTWVIKYTLLILSGLSIITLLLIRPRVHFTIGFQLQLVLSILLFIYALFWNKIHKIIHITLGIFALIPLLFLSFVAIYGNTSNVTYTEDVIIVLGAGINGETVSRPLANRLDEAIAHWAENPNAYIITTGGLGNRAIITEAEAMARYLIARGVPESQILLENYSTSTVENLRFANEILEDYFPDGFQAVLISNDFHMFRAVQTARSVGIYPTHRGAPTPRHSIPANYLRELLAIVNFWFSPASEYAY